jgi:hypothetical protein
MLYRIAAYIGALIARAISVRVSCHEPKSLSRRSLCRLYCTYLVKVRKLDHIRMLGQVTILINVRQRQDVVRVVFQANDLVDWASLGGTASVVHNGLLIGVLWNFYVGFVSLRLLQNGRDPPKLSVLDVA